MKYYLTNEQKSELVNIGCFESVRQLNQIFNIDPMVAKHFVGVMTICPSCHEKGQCIVTDPDNKNGIYCPKCKIHFTI